MVNEKVKMDDDKKFSEKVVEKMKKQPMQRNDGYVGIKGKQKVDGFQ
ncbi:MULTISPECIES: hypothetical protein [Peribacillus]|nr:MULTISPECIES: hypothetical protein [unclassified Peribacillus]MCK1983622.1 hypothetical protein [Peribacillus sp. Aquil_B1]MCK2010849.1 hypothetical protein [Peribacillus sp. Aquil_B8]